MQTIDIQANTSTEVRPGIVRRTRGRIASVLLTVSFLVVGPVTAASASAPTDAADLYSDAGTALRTALLGVAGAVVAAAVTILAVRKGWPMVKRFF